MVGIYGLGHKQGTEGCLCSLSKAFTAQTKYKSRCSDHIHWTTKHDLKPFPMSWPVQCIKQSLTIFILMDFPLHVDRLKCGIAQFLL